MVAMANAYSGPDGARMIFGAIIGAGAGYVVQDVRGKGGSDRLKGAAIGAVGGALCDDAGVCQRRY